MEFELSFFLFCLPRFGSTVDFIGGDEGGCPFLGAEFPGAVGGVAAGEFEGGGAGGGEDVAVEGLVGCAYRVGCSGHFWFCFLFLREFCRSV